MKSSSERIGRDSRKSKYSASTYPSRNLTLQIAKTEKKNAL